MINLPLILGGWFFATLALVFGSILSRAVLDWLDDGD